MNIEKSFNMTATQYKTLKSTGLSEDTIEALSEVFQSKQEALATKQDVKNTELLLKKEIREVEVKVKEIELKLGKEIETVRKEIKEVELKLTGEIAQVKNALTVRMMFFFSPMYIALIFYFIKEILPS